MMNIILLGGPGSGKGTQAERLKFKLTLTHISTGDLFRENLGKNTPLGRKAKTYIDRGELVPDEITISIVKDRLQRGDTRKGIIFDGFPRTLAQAEALDKLMEELDDKINGVFYIEVSDDEIVRRLSGRMICHECQTPFHKIFNPFKKCPCDKCDGEHLYQRDDDKPETVRARLKTYHKQTKPLIDYYKEVGLLITIPGRQAIEDVATATLEAARKLEG